MNFLFHINWKRNLVNLRKLVIYIIFNIIKLVWASVLIVPVRRAQTCELRAKRTMRMCPRSEQIFKKFKLDQILNVQNCLLIKLLLVLIIEKNFRFFAKIKLFSNFETKSSLSTFVFIFFAKRINQKFPAFSLIINQIKSILLIILINIKSILETT